MKYGSCLFSKNKLHESKLIYDLGLNENTTLFINNNDDWNKFSDNTELIIQYNGLLVEEDHETYIGYHYYDVDTDNEVINEKFKFIKSEEVFVE